MPRPEPELPDRLVMLRALLHQDKAFDDPEDLGLAAYRKLWEKDDGKWILQQLEVAEQGYRDDLAAWHREVSDEAAARRKDQADKKAAKKENVLTDPCDVVIKRLLDEWDEFERANRPV